MERFTPDAAAQRVSHRSRRVMAPPLRPSPAGPPGAPRHLQRLQPADRPSASRRPAIHDDLSWLRRPLMTRARFTSHLGRYAIRIWDQPGRWMDGLALSQLCADLREAATSAMADVPTYGIFSGLREAFDNRLIAVAYERRGGRPVGFTAMVYLPYTHDGRVEPIIHLGLTMVATDHRRQRLQTPLFKRIFWLPVLNQRRTRFVITSIAASPAGVGAMSDDFLKPFPTYRGDTERAPWHLDVARQVMAGWRREFGCSPTARLDEDTFVVHGSNDRRSGGAWQLIEEDPLSRYRVDACNRFCAEVLDTPAGDELLQVARMKLLAGPRAFSGRPRGVR